MGSTRRLLALQFSAVLVVLELSCTLEIYDQSHGVPRCGDGVVETGEVCDDGNTVSGDGCSADCKSIELCGNGIVDAGEQCDSGGPSITCNANCTVSRCGDGILNAVAGEQCDAGGPSAVCNANCTVSRCGDGILNVLAGEVCDDGNTINGDGCESNCTPTP